MEATKDELTNWLFEIDEVSMGVYRGTGVDRMGRKVEFTGTDPEKLREELQMAAKEIDRRVAQKARS